MICELTNKIDNIMIKILWFDTEREVECPHTSVSISEFINTSIMFILACLIIFWWWIPLAYITTRDYGSPFAFLHVKRYKCGKK